MKRKPKEMVIDLYKKYIQKKGLGLTTQRERPICFWLIQKDLIKSCLTNQTKEKVFMKWFVLK